MVVTLPLCWSAYGAFPVGVFVVIDPSNSNDVRTFGPSTAIAPLFGNEACSGSGCTGGINGVFLNEQWSDLQSTLTNAGTTTLTLDPNGNLVSAMHMISNVESHVGGSFKFQLSIGLKEGDNAAYNVLDVYNATNGVLSGSAPNFTTTTLITPDEEEPGQGFGCKFQTSGSTITGHGGTFGTLGFPEQCVLHTNSGNAPTCIQQPRMWGNGTTSLSNNALYVQAYGQAMQDYANFVNGISGYGTTSAWAHQFQLLKISGISNHDEEIAIPGGPQDTMPTNSSGSIIFYCGDPNATDAENLWTTQTVTGPPYTDFYDTGVVESTWFSLVAASVAVTSTAPSMYYAIDTVNTDFPPVHPAHCTAVGPDAGPSTYCSYTANGDSSINHLTIGELEYFIEQTVSEARSLLSAGNLSIQTQGLQSNSPDDVAGSNYGTVAVPCAMNALDSTRIGYQSGGTTIVTAADKTAYLASIINGPAYGAQYIELFGEDLTSFVNNLNGIYYGGVIYGTTTTENITMLAQTMATAEATMATNSANSSAGTLCPLPLNSSGDTVPWTYP
jgi:hypothetical protein